jgi:cytochrome c oxidase subunit 4
MVERTPTPHVPHDDAHGHSDQVGHVVPLRILVGTALALLVLTGVTVGVAGVDFAKFDMPELNIWVALGVAAVKASLVALFFMHLRWDRPFNGIVFVLSIAFVALFIGAAMTDSFSYHDDLVEGDSKLVTQKLSELQQHLQSDEAKEPQTPAEH